MNSETYTAQLVMIDLVRVAYMRGIELTFQESSSGITLAVLRSRGATRELRHPDFIEVLNAVSTWEPWSDER